MKEIYKPTRLEIYINEEKKTAEEVREEKGCRTAINLALFDLETYEPVGNLKANGEVICQQWAADKGFFWNGTEPLQFGWTDMKSADNFFSCVRLIENGEPVKPLDYPAEMGGSRERTGFGEFWDGRVLLLADTENKMTPEELQELGLALKLKTFLMMDGGYSTQGASPYEIVEGGRPAYSLLCVWDEETGSTLPIVEPDYKWAYSPGKRSTAKYLILHHAAGNGTAEAIHRYHLGKGWAGIAYHYYVRKDGTIYRGRPEDWKGGHTTGYSNDIGICFEGDFQKEAFPAVQATAGKRLIEDILSRYPALRVVGHKEKGNTSCPGKNFSIPGIYPKTDAPSKPEKPANDKGGKTVTITLPQLQQGDENESVRSLQQLLNAKGYDCGDADGVFGTKTDKAFRAFQKDAFTDKKEWDGICGVKGWTTLLT